MSIEVKVHSLSVVPSANQGIEKKVKEDNASNQVDAVPTKFAQKQAGNGTDFPLVARNSDFMESNATNMSPDQNTIVSTEEEIRDAAQHIQEYVQNTHRDLNFSVDDDTGRTVVKVIDHESKEVIRQIPTEEVLELARRIENSQELGSLFETKV